MVRNVFCKSEKHMKKLSRIVDRTMVYYLIIGILNFIVCTGIMFLLFNLCGLSEHLAPLVNYGLGSVIWYLSCKYILFRDNMSTGQQLLRFIAEVIVCYVLTYYIISPLLAKLVLRSEKLLKLFSFGGQDNIVGNCKMTIGSISYALINYFGQRFFVFNKHMEHHRRAADAPEEKQPAAVGAGAEQHGEQH